MRLAIALLMVIVAAGLAISQDLDSSRDSAAKPGSTVIYQNPAQHKQGGDTYFDATVIDGLPYNNSGTTVGYFNDYDEECPYTGSTSPDVVYSFTPAAEVEVDIDLCGSLYDTKVYVYDSSLVAVACNDDFYFSGDPCGTYVSKIEALPLAAGETYFIFVDGYNGDSGEYTLLVEEHPCEMDDYPADAVDEGEPTLMDGYVDSFNAGCGSPAGLTFTEIDWINFTGFSPLDGYAWLCGKSGWYTGSAGEEFRDTDWLRVYARDTGVMEFTAESEYPTYIFKLAPTDCATVEAEFQAQVDCQAPATLSFPVVAGEEIWLWIGPTTFTGPVTEFLYFATVSNNMYDVVPVEDMSFGGVKALYR